MKRLLGLTILISLMALGASPIPNQNIAKTVGNAEAPVVGPTSLRPLQVIYRQFEGTFLKSPGGVWVDRAKGEVYVADTSNDLIAVYNPLGLPLFAFGYNHELKEPTKAIPDSNGRIYVLNGIPRAVKIFNYRGEYTNDFSLSRGDSKSVPTAIAVDQDNNLYVALTGENATQIQVYDSTFQLVREFGKKPDGSSQLKNVQAITIDADRTVYVADATATPAASKLARVERFVSCLGCVSSSAFHSLR